MLARVRTHIELKHARDRLKDQNAYLEAEVARRMRENQLVQDASIIALARLAETRDSETGNHIRRTQEYVRALAKRLRHHPRFAAELDDHAIELLYKSAPLHDIGKVGIPDHILLKPGKLDAAEWEVMKTHARLGARRSSAPRRDVDQPIEFLAMRETDRPLSPREVGRQRAIPTGLAGDAIPFPARLMALADVFDALISRRVYKAPMSFERAFEIISNGSGRHFDPDVTAAFAAEFDTFCAIATRLADSEEAVNSKLAVLAGNALASGD